MSRQASNVAATLGLDKPAGTGTAFLSARAAAELVVAIGVEAALRGIAAAIADDFRRWPDFQKQARIANHCPDGVIELMPISDGQTWSFKYVNGHPRNFRRARPTVMAFGALARVDSGEPQFLSELTLTTALRTAAMSALAASHLAGPGSRTMALIGNGAQSEFQALAFHHLLGITSLRLYDTDPQASRKLVANLADSSIDIVVCESASQACEGADVVTTVTADASHAAIITTPMLAPGVHLNAVGGDSPGKTELAREVVERSSVFVEFEPQTRVEGEIQQVPADFPVTEFWRVLSGSAPGRIDSRQWTLFDSVGFALEDFSALRFMRDQAARLDLLTSIDLIPSLSDPKDLYSLLIPPRTEVRNARQTAMDTGTREVRPVVVQ